MTDGSLVGAVREGDEAAFGELYRRHHPEISRFVRGRVRDHGRAEDVTQDAFLSALRRLRQTDGDVAFRPWIFEIARNATIDCYRRSSRAEEVSIDSDAMPAADAGRLPGGPQPELSLAASESFDDLREAMHELSEVHRRAIVLRELEGRSYREIGARLHLSQAAVESTLFRARRRLEHEYVELDSGRRCRLVGAGIGRLAEGLGSDRDRRRLDRHARRCSACRRQARTLGVEPMLRRRGIAAAAAALVPLPAFMRRRFAQDAAAAGEAGHGTGAALAPAVEVVGGAGGTAVALLVTAVFVGGGGATLGGAGPLVPPGGQPRLERPAAPPSDKASAAPSARVTRPSERVRPSPAAAAAAAARGAARARAPTPKRARKPGPSIPPAARAPDPGPKTEQPEPPAGLGPATPDAPGPPAVAPANVPDVGATETPAAPGSPSAAPEVPGQAPSLPEPERAPAQPLGPVVLSTVAQVQGS